MRSVGAGIALGLSAAWAASSWFTSVVFGVTPTSPTIYLVVAGVVVAVALVAALVPAMHASRLDPLTALRSEIRLDGFAGWLSWKATVSPGTLAILYSRF
jgi:hypothetical protein